MSDRKTAIARKQTHPDQAAVQPVTGEMNWRFKEQALPSGGYTGQCCFWASEFLLNTALATLMSPGKIQTTLDAAKMVTTLFFDSS